MQNLQERLVLQVHLLVVEEILVVQPYLLPRQIDKLIQIIQSPLETKVTVGVVVMLPTLTMLLVEVVVLVVLVEVLVLVTVQIMQEVMVTLFLLLHIQLFNQQSHLHCNQHLVPQ